MSTNNQFNNWSEPSATSDGRFNSVASPYPPSYAPPMTGIVPPPQPLPPHLQYQPTNKPPNYTAFNANQNSSQMGPVPIVRTHNMNLMSSPVRMNCPYCQDDIYTRTRFETGRMAHIAAAFLCFIGFCCFAFLPYMMDGCKDVVHECPNCDRPIGTYRR